MAKAVVKAKPKALATKLGAPTAYRPEYCQMLCDHMAKGLSFESFSATIGHHRDTLYHWTKTQPDFSDAKQKGTDLSQLYWEQQGQEGLWATTDYDDDGNPIQKKSINAAMWIFNMKNRFKWTDRREETVKTEVIDTKAKEDILLKARLVQELVISEVRQLNEPTQASISDKPTSCDEISRQLP